MNPLKLIVLFYLCICFSSCWGAAESKDKDQLPISELPETITESPFEIRIQDIEMKINLVEDSIRMEKESAGHYAKEIQKAEGYFVLHFDDVLCNSKDVSGMKVVNLMLTRDDCMEGSEASKLYAANDFFSLFGGNQDDDGFPTQNGVKTVGPPIFKSALICDSLGNMSLPYKLSYIFEIDTIERYDTTAYLLKDEEEGFNHQENEEYFIDTVLIYDTLFTYYSNIQVFFGYQEDIENKLVRAKGLDREELLQAKVEMKNQIRDLRMLSNEVVAKYSSLDMKLGRLKTELIKLKTNINNSEMENQKLKG